MVWPGRLLLQAAGDAEWTLLGRQGGWMQRDLSVAVSTSGRYGFSKAASWQDEWINETRNGSQGTQFLDNSSLSIRQGNV